MTRDPMQFPKRTIELTTDKIEGGYKITAVCEPSIIIAELLREHGARNQWKMTQAGLPTETCRSLTDARRKLMLRAYDHSLGMAHFD